MTDDEILQRLQPVFTRTFDETRPEVHKDLTSADVPEWDSLSHVLLIVGVEREFGFRFRSGEVEGMKRVGDMVRLIQGYTTDDNSP